VDKPKSYKAATFAWMIPAITEIARGLGYAVGVHGSMHRDLDLIAVPWTEDAKSAEELVEAIRSAVDGKIDTLAHDPNASDQLRSNPSLKPHGRKAWSIYFSGRMFYIDLSVMPRKD